MDNDDNDDVGIELQPLKSDSVAPIKTDSGERASIWDDIKGSLFDARYWAPGLSLIGFLIAYFIVTFPIDDTNLPERKLDTITDLKLVRPMLSGIEMASLRQSTMFSETIFQMPSNDAIGVRFHMTATKHGHFRLPNQFYYGVTYGITTENPYIPNEDSSKISLYDDLNAMSPKPTNIIKRFSHNLDTAWKEDGYAVFFEYESLKAQGYYSNTVDEPWANVQELMMTLGRRYKQVYLLRWTPKVFGLVDEADPYRHQCIIQQVLPTRTGLNGIKSTVTVWLSSVNGSEPKIPPRVVRKSDMTYDNATQSQAPLSDDRILSPVEQNDAGDGRRSALGEESALSEL